MRRRRRRLDGRDDDSRSLHCRRGKTRHRGTGVSVVRPPESSRLCDAQRHTPSPNTLNAHVHAREHLVSTGAEVDSGGGTTLHGVIGGAFPSLQ